MLPDRTPSTTSAEIDAATLLEEATQPVLAKFRRPNLAKALSDAHNDAWLSPAYIGDNLLLFPDTRRISGKNLFGQEIRIVDLSTDAIHKWQIEFFAFFKLANNDVLIVNTDGVTIWQVKKSAEKINHILVKHIPLPNELMRHFTRDDQYSTVRPFSIKLSPDGRHLGIFYSNRDFYLIDLTSEKTNIVKFTLAENKQEESSLGFVFHSAQEIDVVVRLAPGKPKQYCAAKLDSATVKATLQPKTERPLHLTDDHWNYDVHFLGQFAVFQQTIQNTHHFDLATKLQTDNPEVTDIGAGTYPQTFPQAKMLCFLERWAQDTLVVLSSNQQNLHQSTFALTKADRLAPCGDSAMIAWKQSQFEVVNDEVQVCVFPNTQKLIARQLRLFSKGVTRVVTDYLDLPPDTGTPACAFLTAPGAKQTSIVNCSLFQPVSQKIISPQHKQHPENTPARASAP